MALQTAFLLYMPRGERDQDDGLDMTTVDEYSLALEYGYSEADTFMQKQSHQYKALAFKKQLTEKGKPSPHFSAQQNQKQVGIQSLFGNKAGQEEHFGQNIFTQHRQVPV